MANTSVIEKWVAALQSGDYPQTTGTLQRVAEGDDSEPVGFCCLGVLCDLAVKEGVTTVQETRLNGEVVYTDDDDELGDDAELPYVVREWAGLTENDPYVEYFLTPREVEVEFESGHYDLIEDVTPTDQNTLAGLNDDYGRTFPEIAQIIRDNFLTTDLDD